MKLLVIIVSSNLSHGLLYSQHVYIYSHCTLSECEYVRRHPVYIVTSSSPYIHPFYISNNI